MADSEIEGIINSGKEQGYYLIYNGFEPNLIHRL